MKVEIKEVKLEIHVPEEYVGEIRDALADRGIGRVGNYSHVVSYQEIKGFRKLSEGSNSSQGEKAEPCSISEVKMEVRCPVERIKQAVQIIRTIHPGKEPLIDVVPLCNDLLL